MGYGPDFFRNVVSRWIEAKWLPGGGRIMEFGAQEFHGNLEHARASIREFLEAQGVDEATIDKVIPVTRGPKVADVYAALGIDYMSIDVDSSLGSNFFDLNTFAPPVEWRGNFDLVNNEGTIEHLINPINGFHVAHELLRVGGVAIHSMPLSAGWGDHGYVHPTIRFYIYLHAANNYEILDADILVDETPLDFVDARFKIRNRHNGRVIENAADVKLTNAWIRIALKKTKAARFRIPSDHLDIDRPDDVTKVLQDNFSTYSRSRLNGNRSPDLAEEEFERQLELQRRSHEQAKLLQEREHAHAEALARLNRDRSHEDASLLQEREHAHAQLLAKLYGH